MISIVIPLYNKERSIILTIESVVNQTYKNFELIVVNDGSTDNSLKVVQEYVRGLKMEDWRLKIFTQSNAGVSAARNRGIMEAKGEYVAFLDADDLWTPDYLETLDALIRDYPGEGLYCLGYETMSLTTIPSVESGKDDRYRGIVDVIWNMKKGIWTGSCSSSRDRLIKIGMFDTRMTHGEDLDMWWRLVLDGGLVVDTKCCAYYRQDTENRAMNKQIPLEKHIPFYIDKYAEAREKNAEFRRYFDEQMVYRLYPYMFDKQYRKEARRLGKLLDYTQLKRTMKLRMQWPYLYRIYQKLTGK